MLRFLPLLFAPLLAHANVVVNGGFESHFNSWSLVGAAANITCNPIRVHSGSGAADIFGGDLLSQSLPTVAGASYVFDFWFEGGDGSDPFAASWNGATIFTQSAFSNSYTHEIFSDLLATGSATTIQFSGNSINDLFLDDVGVTAVPEPGAAGMVACALLAAAWALRRCRRA